MLAYCGRMNLIATRVPSARGTPDQTVPIPPDPINSMTRYFPPTTAPSSDGELVVGEIIEAPRRSSGRREDYHPGQEKRPASGRPLLAAERVRRSRALGEVERARRLEVGGLDAEERREGATENAERDRFREHAPGRRPARCAHE